MKCSRRFPLVRLATILLLLSLVVLSTGCSRTPGKKWWQFWKKKPATYDKVEIYPNDIQPPVDLKSPETLDGGSLPLTEPPRTDNGGMVSELKTVHFEYNSYALSSDMQDQLRANAEWIKAHQGITIQIEGHCDERGSTEYNISLGQKRADTVREFLANEGIPPQSLVTISYGEERPMADALGHDEAAWSKNRRVQFLIY
jgi:peptidoglycan-associated lipoprotein